MEFLVDADSIFQQTNRFITYRRTFEGYIMPLFGRLSGLFNRISYSGSARKKKSGPIIAGVFIALISTLLACSTAFVPLNSLKSADDVLMRILQIIIAVIGFASAYSLLIRHQQHYKAGAIFYFGLAMVALSFVYFDFRAEGAFVFAAALGLYFLYADHLARADPSYSELPTANTSSKKDST